MSMADGAREHLLLLQDPHRHASTTFLHSRIERPLFELPNPILTIITGTTPSSTSLLVLSTKPINPSTWYRSPKRSGTGTLQRGWI